MTDERIDAVTKAQWGEMNGHPLAAHRAYSRAIESEVHKEQAEKIATLEQRAELAEQELVGAIEERDHLRPLLTKVKELERQLAEADRRAGAAEREKAYSQADNADSQSWLRKAKQEWGVDCDVSFDVVWAECLELKQQLAEARKDSALLEFLLDWDQKKFALCYREGMSWTPCKTTGPLEQHFAATKAKEQP